MALSTIEGDPKRDASRLGIQAKVAALLDVLDEDIRHIEATLLRLDTLRTLLILRDDASLERLLGEIQQQAETHVANDRKRHMLRSELATDLGRRDTDLTLSELQALLDEQPRKALRDRQVRLKSLIARLRREYALTAVLLSDCARFNRSLMQALFGLGEKGGVTYGSSGVARNRNDVGLMSLQL